jgi:hypothetical protein
MTNRVLATRVKGLLPGASAAAELPVPTTTGGETAAAEEAAGITPEQEAEERRKAAQKKRDLEVRPRRVTSVKGAIILSQDGKEARIRKKCLKCGTEDNKRTTLKILPGTSRTTFFCPNCRRVYPVEITGV